VSSTQTTGEQLFHNGEDSFLTGGMRNVTLALPFSTCHRHNAAQLLLVFLRCFPPKFPMSPLPRKPAPSLSPRQAAIAQDLSFHLHTNAVLPHHDLSQGRQQRPRLSTSSTAASTPTYTVRGRGGYGNRGGGLERRVGHKGEQKTFLV
jgi:hypothetical protein